MKTIRLAAILLAAGLLLAACGGGAAPGEGQDAEGYTNIDVEELAALLETEDVTMVNVHVPYEGEIPETDLFIPYDEITAHLAELPAQDAPIVLYCRSGSMSTAAARDLVSQGYSNVMELDGGFNAWRASGYELLDKR